MTDYLDSDTASVKTSLSITDIYGHLDSASISVKSTPSIIDLYGHIESSILSTSSKIISDEHGPFTDVGTISGSTAISTVEEHIFVSGFWGAADTDSGLIT